VHKEGLEVVVGFKLFVGDKVGYGLTVGGLPYVGYGLTVGGLAHVGFGLTVGFGLVDGLLL